MEQGHSLITISTQVHESCIWDMSITQKASVYISIHPIQRVTLPSSLHDFAVTINKCLEQSAGHVRIDLCTFVPHGQLYGGISEAEQRHTQSAGPLLKIMSKFYSNKGRKDSDSESSVFRIATNVIFNRCKSDIQ